MAQQTGKKTGVSKGDQLISD